MAPTSAPACLPDLVSFLRFGDNGLVIRIREEHRIALGTDQRALGGFYLGKLLFRPLALGDVIDDFQHSQEARSLVLYRDASDTVASFVPPTAGDDPHHRLAQRGAQGSGSHHRWYSDVAAGKVNNPEVSEPDIPEDPAGQPPSTHLRTRTSST